MMKTRIVIPFEFDPQSKGIMTIKLIQNFLFINQQLLLHNNFLFTTSRNSQLNFDINRQQINQLDYRLYNNNRSTSILHSQQTSKHMVVIIIDRMLVCLL